MVTETEMGRTISTVTMAMMVTTIGTTTNHCVQKSETLRCL
jgi:hypothetical protein